MPKIKVKIKPKKGIPRMENDAEHAEDDPPTSEYRWINKQNHPSDPSKKDGVPPGLEDMSEIGAIAWVHRNCKFAKQLPV